MFEERNIVHKEVAGFQLLFFMDSGGLLAAGRR